MEGVIIIRPAIRGSREKTVDVETSGNKRGSASGTTRAGKRLYLFGSSGRREK